MGKLMRKGHRYFSLVAVLITVMGCGLGSVLAGERIVLVSDIEWTEESRIDVTGEKEVEMGKYQIRVGAGSRFGMCGNVRFRGSGDQALFEVRGDFARRTGWKSMPAGMMRWQWIS